MLCASCGRCCVDYLVDLTEEEIASGKYEWEEDNFNEMAPGILKRVQDAVGCWRCVYLRGDNVCSIYSQRPSACRSFCCDLGDDDE